MEKSKVNELILQKYCINNKKYFVQIFADWKSNTKKKARAIRAHQIGTGGGPPTEIKINELEDKLLNVIGRVVIDGAPNVPEVGLDDIILEAFENNNDLTANDVQIIEVAQADAHDHDLPNESICDKTIHSINVNKNTNEKRETAVMQVTEAYKVNQELNRDMYTEFVNELRGIKESVNEMVKVQKYAADIELAKAKAKYNNFEL